MTNTELAEKQRGYLGFRNRKDSAKNRPAESLIIAMEDFDLSFTAAEVACVQQGWAAGKYIRDMADELKRPWQEIMTLLMDMEFAERIEARPGGWRGKP